MRIDHHAYHRATRVAGFGLLLQLAMGVLLFLFGNVSDDTTLIISSLYVLPGTLVWIGLIIIFHQHKLERLEALEEDELTATRAAAGSFFDRAGDETRVAARRLAMMHRWFIPALSLLIAAILSVMGWMVFQFIQRLFADTADAAAFQRTDERGWAIAICLAVAAVSFIFSRFVAGMAKQPAWQNLRGGAAYMVGNALVMLAVAAGIIFRFFENERVIEAVAYAVPVLMMLLAAEIVLNFILNLYRPRIPGEVPRPAFDSKFLSLFATPDSIVRSLNEAVNYQFGFDVTSSWGYQLLLRSFASLIVLAILAMVLLSTMVIVEPHQQAVKLRFGKVVDDRIYESGLMWKWPWPIESADVHDVSRLRSMHLTAKVIEQQDRPVEERINLWRSEPPKTDIEIEPFIVGSPVVSGELAPSAGLTGRTTAPAESDVTQAIVSGASEPTPDEKSAAAISDFFSLVDAEIVLVYRIGAGRLMDYLHFAPETFSKRGQALNDRERALRSIALAQVSQYLSTMAMDDVMTGWRINLGAELRDRIQRAFDQRKAGVEVVAVTLPMLRPSGETAASFEELNISAQARRQRIAQSRRDEFGMLTQQLGSVELVDEVLAGIDEYDRLRWTSGSDSPEAIAQRQAVVDLLLKGGGFAAKEIAAAERDRWVTLMNQRAQALRVQGQTAAFRAAPELYRQLHTMEVFKAYLPYMDKYMIAIDPALISIDADLKKINSILEFAGASEAEKNMKKQ